MLLLKIVRICGILIDRAKNEISLKTEDYIHELRKYKRKSD